MAKVENRGKQFFNGKNFQIKGRVFYPHLLTPKVNAKDPSKKSYGCMFAWKPEENPQVTQMLIQLMQQTKQQFHPTVPDLYWVNPIKHFDNPNNARQDGKPHPEYLRGHHWINANANVGFEPKVIKRDPMSPSGIRQLTPLDEAEVYSGRNAVISISFWLLDTTKFGVSVNLDGILLEEGGEKILGEAGIDPSQAFASFLGNMGGAPANGQYNPGNAAPYGQAPVQNQQQYAQPAVGNGYNGAPAHNAATNMYQNTPQQAEAPAAYPSNPAQPNSMTGMPNMPWNNGQGGGLV